MTVISTFRCRFTDFSHNANLDRNRAANCGSGNRWLWTILCIGLLIGQSATAAEDPFIKANNISPAANPAVISSNSASNNLLGQADEFLPVDQAYQWATHLNSSQLVIRWTIAPGYYLYQERFKFRLADGTKPTPLYNQGSLKYDELFERETLIHHDLALASFDLAQLPPVFDLTFEYQGCAEAGLCYPPQKHQIRVNTTTGQIVELAPGSGSEAVVDKPAGSTTSLKPAADSNWFVQAIIFALLGGAILNLMPCVFPVLSIKMMSLATADRSKLHINGWVYTLGIVCCFLVFASILLLARAGGEALGWGFQLQAPGLIASLAYLFFILGLSMSGLVEFGGSLMGIGQKLTEKRGLSGSFFTGALAAVVASPCTAPFMGAALGFALTQSALVCLSVFAALGLGMALPLLLLCYIPALTRHLPKPGPWMDRFKQFLAFPLYLSAVWLLWVYGHQTSATGMAGLCIGAVSIAFGFWLLRIPPTKGHSLVRNLIIAGAWITAVILPYETLHMDEVSDTKAIQWQSYSPELLASLRAEGRPVFINLTADWCLTCLANERVTLNARPIAQLFAQQQVVALKGDWTNTDPHISQLLQEYGRSGVPLYLWFPAGNKGPAEVLPQILTQDELIRRIGTH